ncbi:putative diguanylate cyclase YeaP [mine drainage metagenome]|jgi:diguanylate cyclase (GGDEF)-like protein/PAS domain S-box-containing protein|uniref:Putative diguanylate cyclase YeaP n=1 Tax=mine drainage metagenome TaxID=410659 RepID=A0A1J5R4U2_9ZZZZ
MDRKRADVDPLHGLTEQPGTALAARIVDAAPVVILILDGDGRIVYFNGHFERLSGWALDEVRGAEWVERFIPQRLRAEIVELRRRVLRGQRNRGHVNPVLTRDGREIEIEWHDQRLSDAQDARQGLVAVGIDVSQRERAVREMQLSEEGYRSVVETMPDGFWVVDLDGRLREVNDEYCRMSGYARAELIGAGIWLVEAIEDADATAAHIARVERQGFDRFESLHRRRDGNLWPVEVTVRMNPALRRQFVFIRDLSAIKAAEAERLAAEQAMRHMAFHDALTQLPNRRLLADRTAQVRAALARDGGHGGLLFVDLDDFKRINDRHGHDAGDALLVEVAKRLKGAVRAHDTVARIGGDEFVVMLAQLPAERAAAGAALDDVAAKLEQAIAAPVRLGRRVLRCRASLGGTLFGAQDDLDAILARADAEMYAAKETRQRAADEMPPA